MMQSTMLPAPSPCELWLVDLHNAPTVADLAKLSGDELTRAGCFVFESDGRRFLAAHCALRERLAEFVGMPPELLQFQRGAHGKPELLGEATCSFNLSHSADLALIGLSREARVGVDVEMLGRPLANIDALAEQYFSRDEYEVFRRIDAADRRRAFLLTWTRKEACLKALGLGLRADSRLLEVGLAEREQPVPTRLLPPDESLHVRSIFPAPGAVGAIAWIPGGASDRSPASRPGSSLNDQKESTRCARPENFKPDRRHPAPAGRRAG